MSSKPRKGASKLVVVVPKGPTTSVKVPADTSADWTEIDCNPTLYEGTIDTLRGKFAVRSGAKWVKIKPTGTGNSVRLCIDGKSLYVNAIRGLNDLWYYFSDATGSIPAGATKGQKGHYSQLSDTTKTSAQQINKALAALCLYQGVDVDPQLRADLCLIVQLVAEPCRFTSVCTAMKTYLEQSYFDLTSTEAIVKNWQSSSLANDPNVIVRWQA